MPMLTSEDAVASAAQVKDELDNKDKLSKSLRKAVANMPFLLETHEKVVVRAASSFAPAPATQAYAQRLCRQKS